MFEYDVKWRCWSEWDVPTMMERVRESHAVCVLPTGSEVASNVVWQEASNNSQGVGLWTEDRVIVEIVEPQELAGFYSVEIKISVSTNGREMTADEAKELFSETV